MSETSRREFIAAGTGALAMSAVIFKAAQGWLGKGGQYLGRGLQRPLDGPLSPSASAEIDPVAHALNRFTFGPGPGSPKRHRVNVRSAPGLSPVKALVSIRMRLSKGR